MPLDSITNRGYFSEDEQDSALDREQTLEDLKRPLSLKTKQIKKYDQVLLLNSNFL